MFAEMKDLAEKSYCVMKEKNGEVGMWGEEEEVNNKIILPNISLKNLDYFPEGKIITVFRRRTKRKLSEKKDNLKCSFAATNNKRVSNETRHSVTINNNNRYFTEA